METGAQIAALNGAGQRLAAAAAAAGPEAPVPSCPGWVVRDLVRHQGGVHRWATGILTGPRTERWDVDLDEVVGTCPADGDLTDWFAAGLDGLTRALEAADPALACWTFLPAPSPLAMWARRQAHETSVHRVDAELAAGWPVEPFAAPFAADGISELLTCFITRPGGSLRADPARLLGVRCTDTAREWLVSIEPDRVTTTDASLVADGLVTDGLVPDCLVTGRAEDIYLALWNRRPASALGVSGDAGVLDLFLDRVHVRWS
jgi:uncharacterized protein (TIGR03083 family)